jgi:hypothetical protein
VTEKVFHIVPQTLVHESLAVAINISSVIATKILVITYMYVYVFIYLFVCGCIRGHKIL